MALRVYLLLSLPEQNLPNFTVGQLWLLYSLRPMVGPSLTLQEEQAFPSGEAEIGWLDWQAAWACCVKESLKWYFHGGKQNRPVGII